MGRAGQALSEGGGYAQDSTDEHSRPNPYQLPRPQHHQQGLIQESGHGIGQLSIGPCVMTTGARRIRRRPPFVVGAAGILGLLLLGLLHAALVAATVRNCPGSPLILTEPDSAALDAILTLWGGKHEPCYGRIVLAAPGIYRIKNAVRRPRTLVKSPQRTFLTHPIISIQSAFKGFPCCTESWCTRMGCDGARGGAATPP